MQQVIRTAPRIHPLVAAAAVSVIAASAAAIALMTGMLPGSHAGTAPATVNAPPGKVAPVESGASTSPSAPAAATDPVPAPLQAMPAVPPKMAARSAAKPRNVKLAAVERMPGDNVSLRPASDAGEPPAVAYSSGAYGNYGGAQGSTYGNPPVQAPLAQLPPAPPAQPAPVAKPACGNCGVVESVVETSKPGEGSGLGIAGGALGGAVVGKQFGKGRGQDFLTVLGAVGGAFAGNQIEKTVRASKTYEVRVRMEDGSVRSVTQDSAPGWRNGDRVRVDGNSISAGLS